MMSDLYDSTIHDLQHGLAQGAFSVADLVRAYLARIEEVNRGRSGVCAVICVNQNALACAEALDREQASGNWAGPLHGVPILLVRTVPRYPGQY